MFRRSAKAAAGNSRLRRSLLMRFVIHHLRAAKSAAHEIIFMPSASLITSLVIGIAMALPLGLFVLLENVNSSSLHVSSSPTLSVYLTSAGNEDLARASLVASIEALKGVSSLRYISPDKGLKEFQSANTDASWMANMADNPLPGVLIIRPTFGAQDVAQLQSLKLSLQGLSGVDLVQLDSEWVERFSNILSLTERLSMALAALFSAAVVLITANAIRLTTAYHKQEMQVLRLIGAAHSYIRRPLLYRGAYYGFVGALIAVLLVSALIYWLSSPILAIAQSYETMFSLHAFYPGQIVFILACGSALGFLGAMLALMRHLRQDEQI